MFLCGWYNTPGNSTGVRQVLIDVAGITVYQDGTPAGQNLVGFSLTALLKAGETIDIRVTQTSASELESIIYVHSNAAFTLS